jgi:hypothetical protein
MDNFETFIANWQHTTYVWGQICLGISVLILIIYFVKLSTKKSLSKKHEYMSDHEIKALSNAGLAFTFAFILFTNGVFVGFRTHVYVLLIFKTFVTLIGGLVVGSAIKSYMKVYYPFILQRRLNAIRFKPRFNPNNGNKLRLLTEDEEDIHLTDEMIEHENIFAYEYDVWVDDETDFKIIETYSGELHLQICEECNFRTSKEYKQEVLKEPTGTEPGEVMNYYRCSYCDHLQKKKGEIPPLAHVH